MRIHWHCQGWGVRAFPCHLSRRLCCPCVTHGDKDGVANNRDITSGKAICSLSSVISGRNWMCPKRALPTYLITAQGCASGSFVSVSTGGFIQHQSKICGQTPTFRALQELAATSGCTESLQYCLAMSQETHKYWPQIEDLRTQGHINLGCTKRPVSRARLLQWTYRSWHLPFQDKVAINAPFKFWLWKAPI